MLKCEDASKSQIGQKDIPNEMFKIYFTKYRYIKDCIRDFETKGFNRST